MPPTQDNEIALQSAFKLDYRAILLCLPVGRARTLHEAGDLVEITPDTLIDIDRIMDEVQRAGTRCFAMAWQETRIGEVVTASAVVDPSSAPIGGIRVSAVIDRSNATQLSKRSLVWPSTSPS